MQKIMFNDKYGLTAAVLEGRKTMTRRVIRNLLNFDPRQDWMVRGVDDKSKANIAIFHNATYMYSLYPQYQPGEVVAVAQSYKDLGYTKEWVEQHIKPNPNAKPIDPFEKKYPGWTNKMFVCADFMPNQIRILDFKAEQLQDISDDDCLKEGLIKRTDEFISEYFYTYYGADMNYAYIKTAFADLIDKVSGKGTWERNPYVFAYEFELVK